MGIRHTSVGTVQRTRVLDQWTADAGRGVDVMIASAPAGSGKTVLLGQWVARRRELGELVAGVTVERGERPSAFWSSVIAAVRQEAENADYRGAMSSLHRIRRVGKLNAMAALREFVESLPKPLWIVIDDTQELADGAAPDALRSLLGAASARMRIVIGARYAPMATLSRLLLEGRASEARMRELAFDRDEARSLLLLHGVVLDDADADLLIERTEGWAAGLRLAAMALSGDDDPAAFVASFAGDDRAIADYLVSEVLSRLPVEVVDLLLATAVAERVNVELACVLSERDDAGVILSGLAATNSFVDHQRHAPGWYRYHPLLRSYLLAEATRREPGRPRRLHARAADWFEQADEPAQAMRHAIDGGHWSLAGELIGRHGVRLLLTNGPDALRSIITRVPREAGVADRVALVAALTALDDGDLPAAMRELDRVAVPPSQHDTPELRIVHEVALLHAARLRGEHPDELARKVPALDGCDSDDHDHGILIHAEHGACLALVGEFAGAEAELVAVSQLARRHARDNVLLACMTQLCAVAAARCDFALMESRAEEAVEFATARGWDSTPRLAFPHAALAHVAWQANDVEAAARYAAVAAAEIDPGADPFTDAAVGCMHSITRIATGAADRFTALADLRTSDEHWRRVPPSCISKGFLAELGLALRFGDVTWATDVVQRADGLLGESGDIRTFRAMLAMHTGRESAAAHELEPLAAGTVTCHAVTAQISASLLTATLADRAGEPARSFAALTTALRLAAPRRVKRGILDTPGRVRPLLVRNRGRFGEYEDFVAAVLNSGSGSAVDPIAEPLVGEALTTRELDVLRDLPSLLSLREIADAHVVSVNTVKTHLKAVYRKLGASTRREAVDRAREIGIL